MPVGTAILVGMVVGIALMLLPRFFGWVPKIVLNILGLLAFLVTLLVVVDALGGGQVFGLLAWLQGLPWVGGFLAGVVLALAGVTITANLLK